MLGYLQKVLPGCRPSPTQAVWAAPAPNTKPLYSALPVGVLALETETPSFQPIDLNACMHPEKERERENVEGKLIWIEEEIGTTMHLATFGSECEIKFFTFDSHKK